MVPGDVPMAAAVGNNRAPHPLDSGCNPPAPRIDAMRITLPALATAIAVFTAPALAADKAQTFVYKATIGGMFEVKSSQLALKMSKDPDVKKFADMMVSDHGAANAELEAIAKEQGLKVPGSLDKEHAVELKSLRQAGASLDAPYVKAQLEGHAETVKMFEQYAESGDNEALQNFAVKTLPTLRTHLDTIEQMGDRVGAINK
jgi:putative membrane protein